ncbi:terpenoid cyclases/protein prenyltransferase alpha-alpha toroid [Dipodascopsis tothii]|uniref:terpenoid cyclases/protein prenyltransferase alpha-alpha toroid n=1 Tax=Dipodascopsis tothii TaxID=44089 RepID=UPI0034CD5207
MAEHELKSERAGLPRTDRSRWRVVTDKVGRFYWKYLRSAAEADKWPQNALEKQELGLPTGLPETPPAKTPWEAALKGLRFLREMQTSDGFWICRYTGPMFLLPGFVIAYYASGEPFPEEWRVEMTRGLVNLAHDVDGGWGLHMEDKSTVFGTALNYVALRLLGMDPDHPVAARARATLHRNGGALRAPHWGKAWLAVLNLYGWEGVNPSPAEFWMLPEWLPIHPGRWWAHTRMVYLPISWLALERFQVKLTPLIESLREELYVQPYASIDFSRHCDNVSPVDLYYPHSMLLNAANAVLRRYERWVRPEWLRKRANACVLDQVLKENYNTDFLGIGPVSVVFSLVVLSQTKGRDSWEFRKQLDRLQDFQSMCPEGMVTNGTNGVQAWDTSFVVQTTCMMGVAGTPEFKPMIERALGFFDHCQFTEDCVPNSYRAPRKGCWPFSTKDQGYVVSDCTAEALKAVIMAQAVPGVRRRIPEERLHAPVDVLLSMQNERYTPGSFASYELIRATPLMEYLNAAEIFSNIMVEYPYVECSDSVVIGLSHFRDTYSYRRPEVKRAIARAVDFIKSQQLPTGGWYGSWGVCYTYATMFASEALSFQGETFTNSEVVRRLCAFLVAHQNDDGGWGESFRSCELMTYVPRESQVVQTAWACIALLNADYPDRDLIRRGLAVVMERQQADGSWLGGEGIEGVFNHSCAIEYPNYKYLFTVKALGMYCVKYGRDAF